MLDYNKHHFPALAGDPWEYLSSPVPAGEGGSQISFVHPSIPAVRRCDLGILTVSFTGNYVPQKFRCLQGYVNSGSQNKSKLLTGIEPRAFSGLCLELTLKCVLSKGEDTGWY